MPITKNYPGERWKALEFDFEFTNDCRIEVSNFGRIRTFNIVSDGKILNGSMINGYRIIRLKLYKPRNDKKEHYFKSLVQQKVRLKEKIKLLSNDLEMKKEVADAKHLLQGFQKDLSKKFVDDLKERTINYHALVHRLVATYFCKQPSENHNIVGHLDYDKMNNKSSNLKWMTPEENYEHQQSSPHVIAKRNIVFYERKPDSKVNKLTVTKVMLLKKLLNEGKPIKTLVKQFKITDTQILRIKRGENWGYIDAAN